MSTKYSWWYPVDKWLESVGKNWLKLSEVLLVLMRAEIMPKQRNYVGFVQA